MKILWEIADIVPGTKVKKPLGDGRFVDFILASFYPGGSGMSGVYGIFHVTDGEFIRVGNGSQEAVVVHLNNCGFKPLEE